MSEPLTWTFVVPAAETEIQALSVMVEILHDRVDPEARTRMLDYLASRFDPLTAWTEDLKQPSA